MLLGLSLSPRARRVSPRWPRVSPPQQLAKYRPSWNNSRVGGNLLWNVRSRQRNWNCALYSVVVFVIVNVHICVVFNQCTYMGEFLMLWQKSYSSPLGSSAISVRDCMLVVSVENDYSDFDASSRLTSRRLVVSMDHWCWTDDPRFPAPSLPDQEPHHLDHHDHHLDHHLDHNHDHHYFHHDHHQVACTSLAWPNTSEVVCMTARLRPGICHLRSHVHPSFTITITTAMIAIISLREFQEIFIKVTIFRVLDGRRLLNREFTIWTHRCLTSIRCRWSLDKRSQPS